MALRLKCGLLFIGLFGVLLSVQALELSEAQNLAGYFVEKLGQKRGICAIPRCGNGTMALAMGQKSEMLVHAMDNNQNNVVSARNLVNGGGFLGKRVYVERGTMDKVPFADNYVDLLLLIDFTASDLSNLSKQEIVRVLTPINGTAIIGNSSSGAITETALRNWANGCTGVQFEIENNSYGVWAILTKDPLPGSDDWTHRFHGPDNNTVSNDRAFTYPYMTQWMGKPYHNVGRREDFVAGNGRLFIISKKWTIKSIYRMNIFQAFNIYNGQLLWKRDLPLKYLNAAGSAVVRGDSLLMVLGSKVVCLNAATGEELGRITFDNLNHHAKRIAISNNIVVVAAGGNDCSEDFPQTGEVTFDALKDATGYEPSWECTDIAAYDLIENRTLWVHRENRSFDVRMFGVANNQVYFFARNSRAGALDLRTGVLEWQNADAAFLEAADWDSTKSFSLMPEQHALMVHKDVVVLGAGHSYNFVGLSTTNGQMIWRIPRMGRHDVGRSPLPTLFMGDDFFRKGRIYNILTGDSIRKENINYGGCGTMTASPKYIVGQCGLSLDLSSKSAFSQISNMHRPQCSSGGFIANGMCVFTSGPCTCDMPTRGFKTVGSANGFTFNSNAVQSERLEQMGDMNSVAPLSADENDWYTHLANNNRSGSVPVSVSLDPNQLFEFKPDVMYTQGSPITRLDVDHRLTPPVTVGGYVFTGGSDGKVRCVEIATSRRQWTYTTGGAIIMAPSIWEGRVFVGSADGYVYALEAKTGRLLWRFRAAPVERRIMIYGQLMSTWPVLTGVIVHDGVAYFGAGYNAEDGTHVYAVDARSGTIEWQNNTTGHQESLLYMGRNIRGGMIIAGGKLWIRSGLYGTSCLDLQTGNLVAGPKDPDNGHPRKAQGLLGAEIGLFKGKYVLYGGQQLMSDHHERNGTLYKLARWAHLTFLKIDNQGSPLYPEISPFIGQNSLYPPAWDEELMVVIAEDHHDVYGWSVPETETYLSNKQSEHANDNFPFYRADRVSESDMDAHPMKQWGPLEYDINAVAVASNAVIMAYEDGEWKVGAFGKNDGSLIWSAVLPDEPLRKGICINRDGKILVALRDGRILCFGDGQPVSVRDRIVVHAKKVYAVAKMFVAGANKSIEEGINDKDKQLSDFSESEKKKAGIKSASAALKKTRPPEGNEQSKDKAKGVVYEMFDTMQDTALTSLLYYRHYPDKPSYTTILDESRIPQNDKMLESGRLRGYIHPPEDGDYTFWVAAGGNAQLWLGENDNPATIARIARNPSAVGPEAWETFGEQRSETIPLKTGEKYYFEVIYKKSSGYNHCAVSWEGPVIRREIISEEYLTPFTLGSGGLSCDYWAGIWGTTIEDLIQSSYYPHHPTGRKTVQSFESERNWADNYGRLFQGYIHPPVSGTYQFWIAADDQAELYINLNTEQTHEKVDGKELLEGTQLLAKVQNAVVPDEFDADSAQKSVPVYLVGGRKYYIRVVHKEGFDEDFCAVQWKIPGRKRSGIDSKYLSPLSR